MKDAISPAHFVGRTGMQVIDVIEEFELDHHRANAVKYILRAAKKGKEHEDIAKAVWYLLRRLVNHGQRPLAIRMIRDYKLSGTKGP